MLFPFPLLSHIIIIINIYLIVVYNIYIFIRNNRAYSEYSQVQKDSVQNQLHSKGLQLRLNIFELCIFYGQI